MLNNIKTIEAKTIQNSTKTILIINQETKEEFESFRRDKIAGNYVL